MPRIFISYRRADSSSVTGRIHDRLADTFGARNVFRDMYDIPAGSDFPTVITREIARADVFLAVIGPKWAGIKDKQGKPRLENPQDFVRVEVETALGNSQVRVIPVLVDGAQMPPAGALPESLRALRHRNAVQVRPDPDFPRDMDDLIAQLQPAAPLVMLRKWWPALVVMVALILAAIFLLPRGPDPGPGPAASAPAGGEAGTPAPVGYALESNAKFNAAYGFSVYQQASQDAMIVVRVQAGDKITVLEQSPDRLWTRVRLTAGQEGWALTEDLVFALGLPTATPTSVVTPIAVEQGFGMRTDAWTLYFTAPELNPDARTEYGINVRLADAIGRARTSVDLALYELSDPLLAQTLIEVSQRGVRVRVVTDDEYGLEGEDSLFDELIAAGIPVITDQSSRLMHDKFFIIDGMTVWTGSWNLTENSTFEQNNNVLIFDSPDLAAVYQAEFEEMFTRGEFGVRSTFVDAGQVLVQGIPVEVHFTPEGDVADRLLELIGGAQHSIRVMAFSFTHPDVSAAMVERIQAGVTVSGIFESRISGTSISEFATLLCAGANMRLDGNDSLMHHKVIIIDDATVITGSLNFSRTAFGSNDDNAIIVFDPRLAAAYAQEFDRLWAVAQLPEDGLCP